MIPQPVSPMPHGMAGSQIYTSEELVRLILHRAVGPLVQVQRRARSPPSRDMASTIGASTASGMASRNNKMPMLSTAGPSWRRR